MKQIVVIGGGPAGYPAALKAASLGAQVTLVEKNKLGGVCLNCGCIPSKSFLDAAHRFQTIRSSAALCQEGASSLADKLTALCDFQKIKKRQQAATQKLAQGIAFLLKKARVTVIEAEASFVDEHTLSLHTPQGTQTLTFDGVILATGSEAFYPPPFDAWRGQIYDNTNFFDMPALPKSLAIVGGGVIGCEMAQAMRGLGVEVHLIEMQPRILPLEQPSVSRVINQAFIKEGIHIYTGVRAETVQKNAAGFDVILSDGKTLEVETILVAIGRRVDLTTLHVERLNLEWDHKGLRVNPTTLQAKGNIYGAGDITGLYQLAHAATRQGEVAASNLCGTPAQYHNERVPRAIYTTPEVSSVGLSQAQAEARGLEVSIHKSFFLANGRAVAQDQTDGYAEWICDTSSGKLLGATLVGLQAAELIHIAAVALEAEMTISQLREVIFAHPTFSETVIEALSK